MNHFYSPNTGEHIVTDKPADWMGSTAIALPAFHLVGRAWMRRRGGGVLMPSCLLKGDAQAWGRELSCAQRFAK